MKQYLSNVFNIQLIRVTTWVINVGQKYVDLDAVGFDALIIGFLVTSSIKIRSSILEKKEPPQVMN